MDDIHHNVQVVLERIREASSRAGRDPSEVQLVAATKHVAASRVVDATLAGVSICGENRLQEAESKMVELQDFPDIIWHFIGRIQRRKIKALVGRFALIHSVESLEQAQGINERADQVRIKQTVLLEVNIGNEPSKGGFSPTSLVEALPSLDQLPHLLIRGLMTIPPIVSDPEASRSYFRKLRELAEQIKERSLDRIGMENLSMGMTQDFMIAIEEGATIVRVGTGIFGPRFIG